MQTAERFLDAGAELAEGPVWDEKRQRLYWVDISGGSLHILNPSTRNDRSIPMGENIGMCALTRDGRILVGLEHALYYLDEDGTPEPFLGGLAEENSRNRLNDGKCDRSGRLWIGSMNRDAMKSQASLYRITADGRCTVMLTGVTVSNGIAWSLDNRTMYYIDTPSGILWKFDYNEAEGTIDHRVPLIDYRQEPGSFDGMTIDSQGALWIGHWGGFQVSQWDPVSGKKQEVIHVPVPNANCCCFGGENMDRLFITTGTGRDKRVKAEYPLSGSLFVCSPGATGLPAYRFG